MKYLISFFSIFFVWTVNYAQTQGENISVNNASVTPVPLVQGGTGEISFDFSAINGVTLLTNETVKIVVTPTSGISISGAPTSSDPSSLWSWVEDSFSPGTWIGTLSSNLPILTSEVFTFPIDVAPDAAPTPPTMPLYGFTADLTPHSKDPSADTDDDTTARVYLVEALAPIDLSSFTAAAQGSNALIEWSTASEENNSHFELEASSDGVNYVNLVKIDSKGANGNSNATLNYSFVDKNAASRGSVQYYRLKNVDFDGSFDMSEIVTVDFGGNSQHSIYPNPVIQGQDILINSPNITSIKVYSNAGKLIKEYNENGSDQVSIPTSDFAKGFYLVLINENKGLKLIVE